MPPIWKGALRLVCPDSDAAITVTLMWGGVLRRWAEQGWCSRMGGKALHRQAVYVRGQPWHGKQKAQACGERWAGRHGQG